MLGVARSTAYYREHERIAAVDEVLEQRIKHLVDAEPYLGDRMVWARIMQIKGGNVTVVGKSAALCASGAVQV